MTKFLLSSFMILASLSISNNKSYEIGELDSAVQKYEYEEVISQDSKLRYLSVGAFDIVMKDFNDSDKISFNFTMFKQVNFFQSYFVYLLNEDKTLVTTLTSGSLNILEEEKEVFVEFSYELIKNLGNTFYIRIGNSDVENMPFNSVVDYMEFPLSNLKKLVIDETQKISFITEVHYNQKNITLVKEFFEVTGVSKDEYVDLYYKFKLTPVSVNSYANYTYPASNIIVRFYVYDELYLFNSAFKRDEEFENYAYASTFFQSSTNNTKRALCLSMTYCIDRNTFLMSSSRSTFSYYFRDSSSIYFPINYYHTFKEAKVMLSFSNFGRSKARLFFPFTLHFSEVYLTDGYVVIGEEGIKRWTQTNLDEVKV